ncbi:MAG: PEGA domain-containing protein [bacterium]
MSARSKSFGPRPYRAAADTILRLLRIFIPLILVGAAFYFFMERSRIGTGQLRVLSDVKGAEISIDGIRVGAKTDTTLPQIATGRRSVGLQKAGYVSQPEVIFVTIEPDTLAVATFRLVPGDTAKPSKVDSSEFLETLFAEIAADSESLSSLVSQAVEADSYICETRGLDAVEEAPAQDLGSPSRKTEETSSAATQGLQGTSITVSSNPPGARIIINGDTTDYQTNCTFRDLSKGTYYISAYRQGYLSKPETLRVDLVRDYQSESVAFGFVPDKRLPSPQLTLITQPIEAGIRVDGKSVGKGRIVLDKPFGKFLAEFENASGYQTPPSQSVELTAEKPSLEIVGRYERLEGKALLAVIPARGESIRRDSLRIWIDNEMRAEKPAGNFDGVLFRKVAAGNRSVRIRYQDMVESISVDLTDEKVSVVTIAFESLFSKKKLRLRAEAPTALEKWQKQARSLAILEQD